MWQNIEFYLARHGKGRGKEHHTFSIFVILPANTGKVYLMPYKESKD